MELRQRPAPATSCGSSRAAPVARCAAYGLRLNGVGAAADLLGPAQPGWPAYELSARVGGDEDDLQWVSPDSARVRLAAGGHVDVDRRGGRAVFTLPAPARAAELVHPHLASAAAVAGRWLERESFHAGALATGGGAWVVLGDKGAGKSTLLALLALDGHAIVADDVTIVDRRRSVMAGPRLIDLRGDAAERLGTGRALGRVGLRERWRMSLGPAPALLPLRGFVSLGWSEEVAVVTVGPGERLSRLLAQRVIHRLPPRDPAFLLELGTLPMLELRRPRAWEAGDEAAQRLLDETRRFA